MPFPFSLTGKIWISNEADGLPSVDEAVDAIAVAFQPFGDSWNALLMIDRGAICVDASEGGLQVSYDLSCRRLLWTVGAVITAFAVVRWYDIPSGAQPLEAAAVCGGLWLLLF